MKQEEYGPGKINYGDTTPIFRYHSGHQALVYPDPVTSQSRLIPTKLLREAGWLADDIQMLRCLPRADGQVVKTAAVMPFMGRRH